MTGMRSALRKIAWLTLWTCGLWLLLAVPAYCLAGLAGLEGLSYAAAICLVPGWLVFLIASGYGMASKPGYLVLLSTPIRLLSVLFGVLGVQSVRADLQFREFLIWILVFYLATLFVETLFFTKHASP